MADISGRKEKERILATAVSRELARFGRLLARTIPGLAGVLDAINPDYWSEHTANLTSAISPNIQQTYIDQAETMMDDFSFLDIDWALVNTDAANWARDYTFELITGLNSTSQRATQAAITNYFEQGWTQGDLRQALTGTFGPRRADMIAVTETTRAAAEGEREAVRRLAEDDGILMRPIWLTREDELVCPICGPRADLEIKPDNATRGEYPPAHPRCRCTVRHEIVV